eukprot:3916172-Amphidinium_carterae.1
MDPDVTPDKQINWRVALRNILKLAILPTQPPECVLYNLITQQPNMRNQLDTTCLLYTSDAADDTPC